MCVLGVRDSSVLCAFVVRECVRVYVCLSVFVLARVSVWCVWYRVYDACVYLCVWYMCVRDALA